MQKNSNIYHRIIIGLIMLVIVTVIFLNFIIKEKFDITWEIIICFALIIVLGLSEMFDNLSIPKLISLSKNQEKLEKENKDLKDANLKIINQLMNIKMNSNIYVNPISKEGSDNIKDLDKAIKEDIEIKETSVTQKIDSKKERDSYKERIRYRENLEMFLLKKVLKDKSNIQYNVVLTNNTISESTIMKNEARFDACVYENNENHFYEIITSRILLSFNDKLYSLLLMIDSYRQYTHIPSKLILVIPKMDSELEKVLYEINTDSAIKRVMKRFEPAINNKLLEIKVVDITKKELDEAVKLKSKS